MIKISTTNIAKLRLTNRERKKKSRVKRKKILLIRKNIRILMTQYFMHKIKIFIKISYNSTNKWISGKKNFLGALNLQ